jgi:hypothetical protein
MPTNDRAADIRLSDWAATKNKLSVLDGGSYATFGVDLRQGGMRVSAGVEIDFADLIAIRDMLTRIIDRNAREN